MKFTKKEYNRYVADLAPKSPLAKDLVCSFCIGGLICVLGQLILNEWKLAGLDADSAGTATSVSLIFISAVLTGLSIYDDIAKVAGAGMPLLLILVIQGSIWINFSIPTITGKYLFFLGYLIVSSIQMGANIDYAIVIATRYQELKGKMHHRDAIVETLNFAFPTILTSGSILSICGFLIGSMTSEPVIAGIGESLGRGTVISMFLVMFVLPQILLIGSGIVDKTSFSVPPVAVGGHKTANGRTYVNGMVSGRINGTIHGAVHAVVEGDIDLNLVSGSANDEEADDDETK